MKTLYLEKANPPVASQIVVQVQFHHEEAERRMTKFMECLAKAIAETVEREIKPSADEQLGFNYELRFATFFPAPDGMAKPPVDLNLLPLTEVKGF
jgi:hypothetical protein